MTNSIHIIWFKRDLRVSDHAPLTASAQAGRVLPLYIIEPELWKLPDSSRRHWHFIHDSLLDLQRNLAALGAPLVIRIGEATEVLEKLRHELGAFTLWSHEETGNGWTYRRDIAVAQWCRAHSIIWRELPSNGVVRRLKSRDGWAKLRDERMGAPIIPAPQSIVAIENIQSHDLPDKNHAMFGLPSIGSVQTGGRKEGIKTLDSFVKERGRSYMQTISKPGVSARHCSRLSAHITFGTLSVREVEQATKAKLGRLQEIVIRMRHFLDAISRRFSLGWRGIVILSKSWNSSQTLNSNACIPHLKACVSRISAKIFLRLGKQAIRVIRWSMRVCGHCMKTVGSRFVCGLCWCRLPAIIYGSTGG